MCLPSDMSSSSKRLMPMFCVRFCRLEASGLDDAVLADALSPMRSTSAELLLPDLDREYPSVILSCTEMLSKHWRMPVHTSLPAWKLTHTCTYLVVKAWSHHPLTHPPPLPAVCTGWWPVSGCHWPVRYPLKAEKRLSRKVVFKSGMRLVPWNVSGEKSDFINSYMKH